MGNFSSVLLRNLSDENTNSDALRISPDNATARTSIGNNFTVLTLNIRYLTSKDRGSRSWDVRKMALRSYVRSSRADFICLQEVWPEQLRFLVQDTEYACIGSRRAFNPTDKEMLVLLFSREKFRLNDYGIRFFSNNVSTAGTTWSDTRCDLPRMMIIGHFSPKNDLSKEICVVNTHFDLSTEARLRMAQDVLDFIGVGGHSIIVGDLNAEPNSEPIRLLRSNYRDCLQYVEEGDLTTYHGFGKSSKTLDYIFCTEPLEPISVRIDNYEVNGIHYSDHYGIRATFQFSSLLPNAERTVKKHSRRMYHRGFMGITKCETIPTVAWFNGEE
ncbi:hypothetical protein PCE1_000828 [Barthelona sp. PCE]